MTKNFNHNKIPCKWTPGLSSKHQILSLVLHFIVSLNGKSGSQKGNEISCKPKNRRMNNTNKLIYEGRVDTKFIKHQSLHRSFGDRRGLILSHWEQCCSNHRIIKRSQIYNRLLPLNLNIVPLRHEGWYEVVSPLAVSNVLHDVYIKRTKYKESIYGMFNLTPSVASTLEHFLISDSRIVLVADY
jgi:hypothetical protein